VTPRFWLSTIIQSYAVACRARELSLDHTQSIPGKSCMGRPRAHAVHGGRTTLPTKTGESPAGRAMAVRQYSRVSGREKRRWVPECLGRNRAAPSAHFPPGGSVLPAAKMGVGTMWPLCGTVVDLVGKSWRKSGLTGPPRYEKLAGSDLANAVGHWLPSSKSRFGYRFRSVRSPRI
jgi:hypothetical protein